jgi:hypothetical protein
VAPLGSGTRRLHPPGGFPLHAARAGGAPLQQRHRSATFEYGELWVQAQAGLTGYLFGTNFTDGAIPSFNLSKEVKTNRMKPAGEWNHYEIRVQGDRITLSINSEMVNEVSGIGLRAATSRWRPRGTRSRSAISSCKH